MSKTFVRTIVLLVLMLVFGGGLFVYLLEREGLQNVIDGMLSFGFLPFLGFVGLSMANFCLYALRWRILLHAVIPKEKQIPFRKILLDRLAGFSASYLTPAAQVGGEPVRIAMLVAEGIPAKAAAGSVALDITFELLFYIAFILAGTLVAAVRGVGDVFSLEVIFGIMAGVFLLLLGFLFWIGKHSYKTEKEPKGRVFIWLHHTRDLMGVVLRGSSSRLAFVAFLSFFTISFRVIEVAYIAFFLGVSFTFSQAFLTATLPGIALLLPIPAGVGVFEGGFSLLFTLLGIPLSAIGFALIIRMRDIIFIVIGGLRILERGRRVLVSLFNK